MGHDAVSEASKLGLELFAVPDSLGFEVDGCGDCLGPRRRVERKLGLHRAKASRI